MFSIDCVSRADFDDLGAIAAVLKLVDCPASVSVPSEPPSFQFDYWEIGLDTVKLLLGYAGIATTNTPVGVDGSFDPIADDGEWLVFPLEGLRKSFEVVAAEAVSTYERFGSLDRVSPLTLWSRPSVDL